MSTTLWALFIVASLKDWEINECVQREDFAIPIRLCGSLSSTHRVVSVMNLGLTRLGGRKMPTTKTYVSFSCVGWINGRFGSCSASWIFNVLPLHPWRRSATRTWKWWINSECILPKTDQQIGCHPVIQWFSSNHEVANKISSQIFRLLQIAWLQDHAWICQLHGRALQNVL